MGVPYVPVDSTYHEDMQKSREALLKDIERETHSEDLKKRSEHRQKYPEYLERYGKDDPPSSSFGRSRRSRGKVSRRKVRRVSAKVSRRKVRRVSAKVSRRKSRKVSRRKTRLSRSRKIRR